MKNLDQQLLEEIHSIRKSRPRYGYRRHTFGTYLCAAGVPLRTAQAAMRHSDPSLTANVYTDPKLLDVAGALEALPSLRGAHGGGERGVASST